MRTNRERFLFLTGTRADFGKLKPLIRTLQSNPAYDVTVFSTGMHLQPKFGLTFQEVKSLDSESFPFVNFSSGDSMARIVSKTIAGLEDYLSAFPADYLVVHGDRPEALAGAIVGALNNIKVIHIEGGELSGTVDESIRHAVSKLAHIHLVSNRSAASRLKKLGENPESIFEIGSPEIDVMLGTDLPALLEVERHYNLSTHNFCIFIMHPETTQNPHVLGDATRVILKSILQLGNLDVVAIEPNNDSGYGEISHALHEFRGLENVTIFPSMRFEYYLTLLKNAKFIIGNSSSGVREAPIFGIPSINIGNRQFGRSVSASIRNVKTATRDEILDSITWAMTAKFEPELGFGRGDAAQRFARLVREDKFKHINFQKYFLDE